MKKFTVVGLFLGLVAAVVYWLTMAHYVYPGDSAHLQAVWSGLEYASTTPYPLMAVFARLFGSSNALAPLLGALATLLLFHLVGAFVRWRIGDGVTVRSKESLALTAAAVATAVFIFTPAVQSAATHLDPRLFDFVWALAAMALAVVRVPSSLAWLVLRAAAVGVMLGFGVADSVLFLLWLPLYLLVLTAAALRAGRRPYAEGFALAIAGGVTALIALNCFGCPGDLHMGALVNELRSYRMRPGWLFVVAFATLPFFLSLISSNKALNERPSVVSWIYHAALTFIAILAVATPLSPSSLMEPYGVPPVVTSAYVAAVCGYLAAFWQRNRANAAGVVGLAILGFVLVVSAIWNICVFQTDRGAFADIVAGRILDDLGQRQWFITDGTLDDHLLLAAAERGQKVNLIQLQRDLDKRYLERLGEVIREQKVGGSKNGELLLSLELGVLPFVQDWFAADPSVVNEVAIFTAPDIFYSTSLESVPELFFFGADPARTPDWSQWQALNELLAAPKGWGSYRSAEEHVNPVDRLRLNLRRHLGLIANDRGVYLQDHRRDDEAFAMYELVMNEIDPDNISALFNELSMANVGFPAAVAKQRDLEATVKNIIANKNLRYYLWRIGRFYGYIRSPEAFIRLGYDWARTGRVGDAISQVRRAIDFVPSDKRSSLVNMMANLYANDYDSRRSRSLFEQVLSEKADDHDALIGLMRLELADGNTAKALEYLERALGSAHGPRADMEMALALTMKNDLEGAKVLLKKVTDADAANIQAWSLLAAVTIQQVDAATDSGVRDRLIRELEMETLPAMERQSRDPSDYYVQTTRAFLMLRKNDADRRREARDAFSSAMHSRPDIAGTQDIVLGLDISLDDKENAETHAREVLRRNRRAPLANYVMGSLALEKEEYEEAEAYLRRAAEADKPVPLALNDLAETLRRRGNFEEAEQYARKAVSTMPELYAAWDTLGTVLMDAKRNLDEAEVCIKKACELAKDRDTGREIDPCVLISLARAQLLQNDLPHARMTLRKVEGRLSELRDFDRQRFEELKQSVR